MAILLPPTQFDFPPAVPVIERVLGMNEVHRFCNARAGQAGDMGQTWGCSWKEGGKCYVVRVDNESVRRHELAHCNGWPHDHPGGWGVSY